MRQLQEHNQLNKCSFKHDCSFSFLNFTSSHHCETGKAVSELVVGTRCSSHIHGVANDALDLIKTQQKRNTVFFMSIQNIKHLFMYLKSKDKLLNQFQWFCKQLMWDSDFFSFLFLNKLQISDFTKVGFIFSSLNWKSKNNLTPKQKHMCLNDIVLHCYSSR